MEQTPVLIAGGGPVGLMLALELDYHGIDAILIERNATTTSHPKMDITNARSMELFRRLGVIDALRQAAVPEDHPMPVIWVDSLMGREFTRFEYPTVNSAREQLRANNDGSRALEPSMRISQVHLEPVLKEILESERKHIDVRFGWALETFTQDTDGVTATIRSTASGETRQIRAQFLAGCDGAGSVTRETLGIPVHTITPIDYLEAGDDHHNYLDDARGTPPEEGKLHPQNFMIHWTSPDLALFERFGTAWHIQCPAGWTVISQNDRDTWTIHMPLARVPDPDNVDAKQLLFDVLGCEFECNIEVANAWQPRLGLADSYGSGRVWLAGDSTHQLIPTGGYGMNSGLCDAMGLAWALAANVNGWGTPALFEAYETERRHVGARVRIGSARHTSVRMKIAQAWNPQVLEDTAEGRARHTELGQTIHELGNLENEAWGIEWGYRYDDSPVICHDGQDPPPYEWEFYAPTTWPGARVPNVFLRSGGALFELFGPGFTLLQIGGATAPSISAAAADAGVPLTVLDLHDPAVTQVYDRALVLIRPDQHCAWRGDHAPEDSEARLIIDRVRGA